VTNRVFRSLPINRWTRLRVEPRSGADDAFSSVAPQALQNLSPGSFAAPQRGHTIGPSYSIAQRDAIVYIAPVPVLTGEPRSRVLVAGAVVLIAAVVAVSSFGCGSGDGDSSTETGAQTVTQNGNGAPKASVDNSKGSADRQATQADSPGAEGEDKRSHPETEPEPNRAAPSTSKGKKTAAAGEHEARCPPNLTRAQCAAVVRATTRGAPSNVLNEPRDCLKIMSRAECEALAAELRDAFERSDSFGFEECLQNPTPKCEEVFGPVLEQQRAASQGSEN